MNAEINDHTANELLAESLLIGGSINRMMKILHDAAPSESRDRFIESIGLITSHNADIIMRIRKLFPDLHPMFKEFG